MKLIWAKDIVEEETGLRYSGVAEVIDGEWHIVVNLSMGAWLSKPLTLVHEFIHVIMDECSVPWLFHVVHDVIYALFWVQDWRSILQFADGRIGYYRAFSNGKARNEINESS